MKKGKLIFGIIVLGIVLFNLSIIPVKASDDDSDGIDDEYEYLNKRNIIIEYSEDYIEVHSILRTGVQKDSIRFRIRNDSDGFTIQGNVCNNSNYGFYIHDCYFIAVLYNECNNNNRGFF